MPMSTTVKVIPPRKTSHSCEQGAAHLKCRLALPKSLCELDALVGEGIKVRCLRVTVLFALANDVGSKCVQANADDVHGCVPVVSGLISTLGSDVGVSSFKSSDFLVSWSMFDLKSMKICALSSRLT